jgi:hypothetical protein
MTPAQVIAHIKAIGGMLVLAASGDRLSYVLPSNDKATLEEIRRERDGILHLLTHGENEAVLVGNDGDPFWVGEDVSVRPVLSELVREWLGEHCSVSSRFSSSLVFLHREFSRWAGLQEDSGVQDAFSEQLEVCGFLTDEYGMVNGIAINSDVIAALVYEQPQPNFPDDVRYVKKGGILMPFIISSKQPEYEIPAEGEHQGVLADIVDLGEVPTQYGVKKMVRLTFVLEQKGKDGKPLRASRRFPQSLYQRSALRNAIKSMLGRDPGDTFDMEKLIGTNAWVEIEHHHENGGRTYANIVDFRRVRKGDKVLTVPSDFKRITGKPGNNGTDVQNQNIHGVDVTDDDVPPFQEA